MPEVSFRIRWPDGATQDCYSPSRSIEQALVPGAAYPVPEFVRRVNDALEVASERVRARRGFACTASAAQAQELEWGMGAHAPDREGMVAVESLEVREWRPPAPPEPAELPDHVPVLVVGGGQAGLAASWLLAEQGTEHLVLERDSVCHNWRDKRWDSFCLVTPNWQCQLPGHHYDGDDPDGFMVREEILGYLDDYVRRLDPPVVEGVEVGELREAEHGGFEADTSAGTITADQVVLAAGGYHRPSVPPVAQHVPPSITQLHAEDYRNPASMPDGSVLVVGSGQSGAQIAEDLHTAGRQVHLAVGSAPRIARFYRGRDVVAWMHDMGHYDLPIDEHELGDDARKEANHYVTGRDGGHDIDLRQFAAEGMRLHGVLEEAREGVLHFRDDLAESLDNADAVAERSKDSIDEWIEKQDIDAPEEERYEPVWVPDEADAGPLNLHEAGVTSVVWATGFSSDWSWVRVPAFDGDGYPTHERGVTSVPGLYVLGLPWLYTWGSGRFAGIERDAGYVVDRIGEQAREAPRRVAA